MRPGIRKGQFCYDTESGHPLLCIYVQPYDVYASSMLIYWICRLLNTFKSFEVGGISLIDGNIKFFNIYPNQPIIKYTLDEAVLARKRKMITMWKI